MPRPDAILLRVLIERLNDWYQINRNTILSNVTDERGFIGLINNMVRDGTII